MLKKIVPLCREHGLKAWGHFAIFPAVAREVVEAGCETVSHVYLIDGMEGFTRSFKTKRFSPAEVEHRASIFREMARQGTILDEPLSRLFSTMCNGPTRYRCVSLHW